MYQILQNKFYTNAGHNNLDKKTKTCFLQVGYEKLKPLINLFFCFLFYFFTFSPQAQDVYFEVRQLTLV